MGHLEKTADILKAIEFAYHKLSSGGCEEKTPPQESFNI